MAQEVAEGLDRGSAVVVAPPLAEPDQAALARVHALGAPLAHRPLPVLGQIVAARSLGEHGRTEVVGHLGEHVVVRWTVGSAVGHTPTVPEARYGGGMARTRPYTPAKILQRLADEPQTALEDWLLEGLRERGITVRDPSLWPLTADPHHRADLEFREGRLVSGQAMPLKGPRTEQLGAEEARRVEQALQAVLDERIGEPAPVPDDAGEVRVALPLKPADEG